jgi:hypothetical protein
LTRGGATDVWRTIPARERGFVRVDLAAIAAIPIKLRQGQSSISARSC